LQLADFDFMRGKSPKLLYLSGAIHHHPSFPNERQAADPTIEEDTGKESRAGQD
jgi:hypothetical protein